MPKPFDYKCSYGNQAIAQGLDTALKILEHPTLLTVLRLDLAPVYDKSNEQNWPTAHYHY